VNKTIEYNGAPWPKKQKEKRNNLEVDTIMIMFVRCNERVYMIMQIINQRS
jgi:hypothetical protein